MSSAYSITPDDDADDQTARAVQLSLDRRDNGGPLAPSASSAPSASGASARAS